MAGSFQIEARFSGAVEGAFIGGAIPEERHRYAVALRQLGSEGSASGDRHAGSHNAVGSEHADTEISDVHGAALAVAVAVTAAKQLGHHRVAGRPLWRWYGHAHDAC